MLAWLAGLVFVIGQDKFSQTSDLLFLSWIEVPGNTSVTVTTELQKGNAYRLSLFAQRKDRTSKEWLSGRFSVSSIDADTELVSGNFDGNQMSLVDPSLLGEKREQLFPDADSDPYHHSKVLQSSDLFTVTMDGRYRIDAILISHPPSWKVAIFLNTAARNYTLAYLLLALFFLFFIFFESYAANRLG